MAQSYKEIHPKFKCNGTSYNREELKEVAYSLVKEGEAYEQEIGDFLLDWLDGSDLIHVQTSGSTALPKHIRIKKQQMVHSALATGQLFGLEAGTTALHCLPSRFIAGKMMWVRALVLGWEMDYVAPSSKLDIRKPYDFSAMIPLQLENALSNINYIQTLIVGGAPMSMELREKVQEKDTLIFETYGMTETITHIAVKKVNHQKANENKDTFTTLPAVRVGIDARGCLVIDAPRISHAKVVTNDVVSLLSETEFQWKGRYDNIINSGGIKLVPEVIEKIVSAYISQPFFVAGLADDSLGQRLVLLVEGSLDKTLLMDEISKISALDKFQKPKEIYCLPNFVRTSNGKIQRSNTLKMLS
ncbi:AMP-binding protein [Spongiimicrobium salis]|uniref:AMP-binding protein n=1 Tax=Spongiimicrobium salis TaxID=1667022 RepID=UPI00374D6732